MADRTVTYRLTASITQFKAQMAQASASVKKFADDSTAATKEGDKFRKGLDTFGAGAGKIGLVAAGGLAVAIGAAAKFDKSMSAVAATGDDARKNIDALREAAIKAGAETVFSASEAAGGIESLEKAGVSAADILNGGLQGALDLTAAGNQSVADAADTAATAMNQFGLSGADIPHIADLLAAAAGKAQGEVSDMAYALKQGGLVADQVGLSIEETTGALASFASKGLLGSDAGTSFKQFLAGLTPATEKASNLMADLGINAFDAQGNFIGLSKYAGVLRDGLKDMSSEQRQAALETVFGSDAVRAASIIYDEGEGGVRKWIRAVDDQGYAAETAATKLDNLSGDLEGLKGSLETALIGTGEGAQGPLRGLVQGATDVVNAYNSLPASAKGAVAGMLAATAALGGGAFLGVKVIKGIASTRKALEDLGVSAGQTRAALSGIGKGIEFVAIIEGLKLVSDAVDNLFNEDIDESKLGRSLEALANGQVTGELAAKLGTNLEDIGKDVDIVGSKWQKFNDLLSKVPFQPDSDFSRARDEIDKLDTALAQMVEGGNLKSARSAFDEIAYAAQRQGASFDDVNAQFDDYAIALGNARPQADAFTGIIKTTNSVLKGFMPPSAPRDMNKFGQAAGEAAGKVSNLKAGLDDLVAFFDQREAFRQSRQDMEDFIKTLEHGVIPDETTKKGKELLEQIDSMGRGWADVARNMKDANAVDFLRGKAKWLEDIGRKFHILGDRDIKSVIDKLRETANYIAEPTVGVKGKRETIRDLSDVEKRAREVAEFNGDVRIGAYTRDFDNAVKRVVSKITQLTSHPWTFLFTGKSSGPMIPNPGVAPRKATGGPITGPGTATSDSIPAWLSNGEHVWTAREVANAGGHAAVEAMRANFRYASGGAVGTAPVAASFSAKPLSDNDVARIAGALSNVRPLYGPVTVVGDGSFEREQRKQAARLASGGERF